MSELNSATDWLQAPLASVDQVAADAARARQDQLTKPPGSLGVLERLAIRFAGWQGAVRPQLERRAAVIFAADHGIADEGVSAFPQAVTAEMVRNFARGGAAISVLCRQHRCRLQVVNVGTLTELEPLDGVLDARIAAGTANFSRQPAMSAAQCGQALAVGRDVVDALVDDGLQLFIGGEMGIANTSAASALACALLKQPAARFCGAGTGLDGAGINHKAAVIERALALHGGVDDPLELLRRLGGFELAALVGAYLRAAQHGVPSLVDGFICSAAALVASRLQPALSDWLLFSHRSAEQGHAGLLEALGAEPLLALELRLGEGSGAVLCLPLIDAALAIHNGMATFHEAGVSNQH
ncbi:nicotinate-nucleotide--dimethylbenzimidazole phosphoribosyltransferase [Marinobacterium arenosum]|uniref:nicotinate-nucleotide--dimethylbenzimidazole phosphoribosyltransferase n=1 Tax=Marinobacterium arenosum TaxID=2862496 RepID=UPI001C945B2C|nr:nicotinate-nucleotide--dimethylbenzimidazole phosphoribosyltransferase [Marinobacterium arenosum]MBY4676048.1 nicotinate-nucleotide--dimethylbenzimidazole phosphoribosyltransferase [Marinobacterium arenosum]